MVGQVRPCTRIVGLLGFPGYQTTLDIDLPATRTGAIHTMCRAHDLVMRPAATVGTFPITGLIGRDAIPIGKSFRFFPGEIGQVVEKMTHSLLRQSGVVEFRVFTQIEPPVNNNADTIKCGKPIQCVFWCSCLYLFAKNLGDVERTISSDG